MPVSAPLRLGLCAALVRVLSAAPGEQETSCRRIGILDNIGQVHSCADEVYERATPAQQKKIKKAGGALREARDACTASPEKATSWGCRALTDLAYEIFAEATSVLRICQVGSKEECGHEAREGSLAMANAWVMAEGRFENTPAEAMVSSKLKALRDELFPPLGQDKWLGEGEDAMPPVWEVGVSSVLKIKHWVTGYVWRETHWMWLMDSLHEGRVVQTAWGDADEWLKFGSHDAHSEAPLGRPAPRYLFSDALGMRWEILVNLLKELREKRGGGELQVVEVGVFAGHLSYHLLKDLDFIHLLGVDPYFGKDDTFPGNFSDSLDPDVARYKAQTVMEPYGERAQLWPTTSAEAAANVPEDSVDAVFIDGCHLYNCVVEDLDIWLPKMRRGMPVLIAGHDFSPQWPGVVRAVHELRAGGREVNLASDWMWWYFDHYDMEGRSMM